MGANMYIPEKEAPEENITRKRSRQQSRYVRAKLGIIQHGTSPTTSKSIKTTI
jgi:hypothetical protein